MLDIPTILLKERSLDLVRELRLALSDYRSKQNAAISRGPLRGEDASERFHARNAAMLQASAELINIYESNYKFPATLYKDELLKRVASDLPGHVMSNIDIVFSHPVNPLMLGEIIDKLEYMANCV